MSAEAELAGDVTPDLVVRQMGMSEYEPVWRSMQRFTDDRDASTADEIWLTEHPPVFTLGLNADRSHVLDAGEIPVVQVDRGGQVTYHGSGQLMIYPLIDLRRARLGVRDLVTALESAAIDVAASFGIEAVARCDAPGVYVDGAKLASVGLRIRRGASFHGMAMNLEVNLAPFTRINPCGFSDLTVTSLAELGVAIERTRIARQFVDCLTRHLHVDRVRFEAIVND